MRIQLFSLLAVSALLAPTAAAQAPVSPPAASARFPAPDEPARPSLGAPTENKATDWLSQIALHWRTPDSETAPAPANPDGARTRSRLWVTNEMLTWWIQGMQLPVLISTSLPGTPAANAGVLGPNTSVVSPTNADDNVRLGWRITLGGWLREDCRIGLEVQFLTLANGGTRFSAFSPGDPIIARPIVNAVTLASSAEPIAAPGVASGSIRLSAATSGPFGGGFLIRENFHDSADPCDTCGFAPNGCGASDSGRSTRLDSLLGFRYLRLSDHLEIIDTVNAVAALNGVPAGGTLQRVDRFDSRNNFYGLDLGVSGEMRRGIWSIGALAKAAVGFNNASVDIDGARAVNGVPVPGAGGLLAQTTNIGHFTRTTASAVPELGLKLGCNITPNMQISVGYSMLYWYHLARAANQVNLRVDPAFLTLGAPGAAPVQPGFALQEKNIWVQGFNLGFEWRY